MMNAASSTTPNSVENNNNNHDENDKQQTTTKNHFSRQQDRSLTEASLNKTKKSTKRGSLEVSSSSNKDVKMAAKKLTSSQNCNNKDGAKDDNAYDKLLSEVSNSATGTKNIGYAYYASGQIVKVPSEYDVLLGRGKPYQNHPGNRRMLLVIQRFRKQYILEPRDQRRAIAEHVLDIIQQTYGARFLKRIIHGDHGARPGKKSSSNAKAFWEVVDRKTAFEKVSHALRDKNRCNSSPDDEPHRDIYKSDSNAGRGNNKTCTSPVEASHDGQLESLQEQLRLKLPARVDAAAATTADDTGAISSLLAGISSSSTTSTFFSTQHQPHYHAFPASLLVNFTGSCGDRSTGPTATSYSRLRPTAPTSSQNLTKNLVSMLLAKQQQQQQEQQDQLIFGGLFRGFGAPTAPSGLLGDVLFGRQYAAAAIAAADLRVPSSPFGENRNAFSITGASTPTSRNTTTVEDMIRARAALDLLIATSTIMNSSAAPHRNPPNGSL